MNKPVYFRDAAFYIRSAQKDLGIALRQLDYHPESAPKEEQSIYGCIAILGIVAEIYEKAAQKK